MRQDTRVHRTPHPCWRGLLLLLLVFFCMWHQVSAAVCLLQQQPRCYCTYLSAFRRPIGPIGQPWADKCLLHSIQLSVLLYVTCVRMLCFMCVRPLGAIYLLCRVFMCPYDILLYILPYAPIASRPTQNVSKLFVPYIPTTISISTSASIYIYNFIFLILISILSCRTGCLHQPPLTHTSSFKLFAITYI